MSDEIKYPCENHPDREYHYGPDKHQFCYACWVAWSIPLKFVLYRELPEWVKPTLESEAFCKNLTRIWQDTKLAVPHVTVHVFSRKESETPGWQARWADHQERFVKYGYRGWARSWKNEIVVLMDETETTESLQWIVFHELGHIMADQLPMLDYVLGLEKAIAIPEGYNWEDDAKHEACPEEQFVNRLATALVGQDLNRLWWRKRVNEAIAAAAPVNSVPE